MAPSWIITLHAGASPALMPEPRGPMAQYEFFTSRTMEDGRERFRLHMGLFDDLPTAKSVLRVARETCPAAWLVPADQYPALRRVPKEAPKEATLETVAPVEAVAVPVAPAASAPDAEPPRGESAMLEADEVFALLGGAADLLAGVLPEVHVDDAGMAVGARAAVPVALEAAGTAHARSADALVRDVSRFIVEEWQPEARRPQRQPAERAWYARFRRAKGQGRSQTAAS